MGSLSHCPHSLLLPPVASEEIFKIASMAPGALLLEAQKEYEVKPYSLFPPYPYRVHPGASSGRLEECGVFPKGEVREESGLRHPHYPRPGTSLGSSIEISGNSGL